MEIDLKEIEQRIRDLMTRHSAHPFQPFSLYDQKLKWILVMTQDCSFSEEVIHPLLYALKASHQKEGESTDVGFIIHHPVRLCVSRGLPGSGRVEIGRVLDVLKSAVHDEGVSRYIEQVAKPLLVAHHIPRVSFPFY